MWQAPSNEYMAGFFDGEGSVIMTKNYQIYIVITQSNLELLKGFQEGWGGRIYARSSKLSKKPCFVLRFSSKPESMKFLRAVENLVIVKREKVKLALEMLDLLQETGKRKQLPNGLFAKSDPLPKQRIYEQFRALN